MKFIPALCFCISTLALSAQQSALIEYASISNFHWGLFEGQVNKEHLDRMGQNTGAVTVSSISHSTKQTSASEAIITITARFHTQESWTRYPELSQPDEALNHEKRHLDITEIYARKLRQAVSKTKFSSRHFSSEVNRLFTDYVHQHRAEQARYDQETNHSIAVEQQEKWDKKIDKLLEELSNYEANKIMVKLE